MINTLYLLQEKDDKENIALNTYIRAIEMEIVLEESLDLEGLLSPKLKEKLDKKMKRLKKIEYCGDMIK